MRYFAVLMILVFSVRLHAQVFRCVDDEGVVIFTNIGCPERSEGGEIEVPENITIIDNSNIRKKMIMREQLEADTDLRDYQVNKVPGDQKKETAEQPEVVYSMDMDKCRESLREMREATSVEIEKRNPFLIEGLKYIANMYCGKNHQSSDDFAVLYSSECEMALEKLHKTAAKTSDDLLITTDKIAADAVCLP
ncbi:MAG: DUF4124 domain-containing protein [Pseudomonadales bacterium]|nr:DUF4124 domain-containing protein [Pseudomonadales bacterium]